jgi:signal transduction histidine kinase
LAVELGIEFGVEFIGTAVSAVDVDDIRVRQMLNNLSNNAFKFTPDGSVRLIVVAMARSDGQLVLRFAVQDTGIGIAQEFQHQVFSRFTQADASMTWRFGGTGLGLAICKRTGIDDGC